MNVLIAMVACGGLALQLPGGSGVRSRVAEKVEAAAEIGALSEKLGRALGDKRLVDEVAGEFEYSGRLQVGEREYAGQGAVKRGLAKLLEGVARVEADGDAVRLVTSGGDEFALHAWFSEAGLVEAAEARPPAAEARSTGPKWETDDGRVVQKIWQERDLLAAGNPFMKDTLELKERLCCIVDATVMALYGDKLRAWCESMGLELAAIVAPGNEDEKTMDNVLYMLDELARVDPLRRSEPVLAIGGGVLTDTAGFACALWRRGIPWARMPTTLLGMVDASVGIKVAVNYHRKNGIGHFFSPLHTFIDVAFLPTLSLADVRSGCGEIMKAALVHDPELFDLMETHGERLIEHRFAPEDDPALADVADVVIKRSVDTMLECIGPDLWEESLLRPMDFGHSFSRTLEACQAFKLRHGEAVAIDCVMSTMLANVKGLLSDADADRVLDLYAKLRLPCSIHGITADTYKQATREIIVHRDGILRAPLPQGIGACAFADEFTDRDVERAFDKLQRFMREHPETEWDRSKSFDPGHADVVPVVHAAQEVIDHAIA